MHLEEIDLSVDFSPVQVATPVLDDKGKHRVDSDGKKMFTKEWYTIHIMTGEEKGNYQNAFNRKHLKIDYEAIKGRRTLVKPRMNDYKGTDATLLTFCMKGPHTQNADGSFEGPDGPLVKYDDIIKWPGVALSKLSKFANHVNGLDEDGDEQLKDEAKND